MRTLPDAISAVTPDAVVGVDLGVTTLAVLSDRQCVPNPRHLV
jgi:transposase